MLQNPLGLSPTCGAYAISPSTSPFIIAQLVAAACADVSALRRAVRSAAATRHPATERHAATGSWRLGIASPSRWSPSSSLLALATRRIALEAILICRPAGDRFRVGATISKTRPGCALDFHQPNETVGNQADVHRGEASPPLTQPSPEPLPVRALQHVPYRRLRNRSDLALV